MAATACMPEQITEGGAARFNPGTLSLRSSIVVRGSGRIEDGLTNGSAAANATSASELVGA